MTLHTDVISRHCIDLLTCGGQGAGHDHSGCTLDAIGADRPPGSGAEPQLHIIHRPLGDLHSHRPWVRRPLEHRRAEVRQPVHRGYITWQGYHLQTCVTRFWNLAITRTGNRYIIEHCFLVAGAPPVWMQQCAELCGSRHHTGFSTTTLLWCGVAEEDCYF